MALQRRSRVTFDERRDKYGDLAATVAHRRLDLELTQSDLADLAGVAKGPVVNLETGRSVSFDVLGAVLDALGLHLQIARGAAPGTVTLSPALAQEYAGAEDE